MIVSDLNNEEQTLFDQILSNNIGSIESTMLTADSTSETAKTVLHLINNIVLTLGKVWNEEHDMQGKLVGKIETFTSDTIQQFYQNTKPLFEMIRSRLPVLRSEHRVAVGTLVNVHAISELVELHLREKGYLTYYWGTTLTLKEIKDKQEASPADVFVFSCMAVTSEFNCFEEIRKVRKAFPDIKIIVGGAAFPILTLLKTDGNHPALTLPYKDPELIKEIKQSNTIKEFIKKVFQVNYCETIDEMINEIDN